MSRFISVLSLLVLTGCVMNRLIDDKLEDVNQSDIKEISDVKENTQYVAGLFDLEVGHLIGYGGRFLYGTGKFGSFDGYLRFSEDGGFINNNSMSFDTKISNYSLEDRMDYGFNYSFPVSVNFNSTRKGILLSVSSDDSSLGKNAPTKLIFISDRLSRNTISVMAGFNNVYTAFKTRDPLSYGLVDQTTYDSYEQYNPEYLEDTYYQLFSQTNFVKFGGRFTSTFNSFASINHKGVSYSGRNSTVLRTDANVLVGVNSMMRPMLAFEDTVDITDSISFRRLGAQVSFTFQQFNDFTSLGINSSIGVYPGYYSNMKDAFFVRISFTYGFGKLWDPKK